ncbi:ABC transporter ATP-binding protein [Microbacterium halophytorum]|uniref:ABC transporter ATP-binding protein n=1 Tax=Microbacterium halophytorum TaxID=2067568 RepID=UPI000CFD8C19|nr:ABC transporter ATP-binding protein [Microbacterium halophytorum]
MSKPIVQTTETKPSIIIDHVTKRFRKRNARSMKDAVVGAFKGTKVRSEMYTALDDVSFQIGEGESVAVMGMNGSGKSTTLKMVSGVLEPDEGRVFTRGRVAGLIEVGAGFHPELTGRDNVYLNAAILGMSKEETDARYDDIVAFSEIGDFIDQEVKHYSSGMFMRLAFSVAIHVDADVLLVDEILSVGDAPFRRKCNEKLHELVQRGVTMMIVSHNKNVVKKLCSRGIVIRDHEVAFDGPIDEAIAELGDGTPTATKKPATPAAKPAPQPQEKAPEPKPAEAEHAEAAQGAPEAAPAERVPAEPTAPVPAPRPPAPATPEVPAPAPQADPVAEPSQPLPGTALTAPITSSGEALSAAARRPAPAETAIDPGEGGLLRSDLRRLRRAARSGAAEPKPARRLPDPSEIPEQVKGPNTGRIPLAGFSDGDDVDFDDLLTGR